MISIIIPYYDEEKNIPILLDEIKSVMNKEDYEYEVILVDDGSQHKVEEKYTHAENIHLFFHKKRMGKGEALRTGVKHAQGDIITFMDGDLQDDPNDVKKFIHKLNEGNDLVNGIREQRKDSFLIKIYSFFANIVLRTIFHSPFTDINCGFKMFKKETLNDFPLYGNNFRFFPLSTYYRGYKVSEVLVHNRKRLNGESKFGPFKLFTGILDMVTAYFVYIFAERPLHFFGTIGGVLFLVGFIISLYLAFERIFFNVLLYRRPMLQLGIVLIIVGIQVVMTGLIGELIVYLDKNKK
ncbi:MAG: glycosyltransferase [Candidatus Roizmanbacteria bacterium]|nr:glycosyltransferase [Candidatus Roizmanbacteria bacterium]